jgi:hypothetical protein
MLNLSTSNLLAQKPYTKIRKDVEQGPLLDIDDRISKLRQQLVKSNSDIFLFQEVDEHWEKVLYEFSETHGYFILIRNCRKLKMAIAYKSDRFQGSSLEKHHSEVGIFSISLFDKLQNKHIKVVNIHADWGKANLFTDSYNDIFQNQDEPMIIGGDFNLDSLDPSSKNENKAFFEDLIARNEYVDLTSGLPFTAKYVKDAKQGCNIDLVLTKNTTPSGIASIFPENFNKLLPHTEDHLFNAKDPNNHYSDHTMITVSIHY